VPDDVGGWTPVSATQRIGQNARIPLRTNDRAYRYYLLWIVSLPPGNKADVRELSLKK
jgi:hypothetical protein